MKHGLRAALTPVVTILGLQVAFDLTGAVFTESIFGLSGLGLVTLRAFDQYDLPVLMGGVAGVRKRSARPRSRREPRRR